MHYFGTKENIQIKEKYVFLPVQRPKLVQSPDLQATKTLDNYLLT